MTMNLLFAVLFIGNPQTTKPIEEDKSNFITSVRYNGVGSITVQTNKKKLVCQCETDHKKMIKCYATGKGSTIEICAGEPGHGHFSKRHKTCMALDKMNTRVHIACQSMK